MKNFIIEESIVRDIRDTMRRSFTIVINRVTAKRKEEEEEERMQEDELRRNNVNHLAGPRWVSSGFPIAMFSLSFLESTVRMMTR